MNFQNEMESYFNLRTRDERTEKLNKIISQLEKSQMMSDPVNSLNLAEIFLEYCLLIDNNDERLLKYEQALKLVLNARPIFKKMNQIRQFLRSYHLECFIKYHIMKYEDEEVSIQEIFNLGDKIIKFVTQVKIKDLTTEYDDYYSLGCVWRAYGLLLQFIHKFKELEFEQKRDMLDRARELANKAIELSEGVTTRDAHILSAYIFAFIGELPKLTLHGDMASTEEDFIEFMHRYEILFEIAHAYGSIEFEYLALLNHARLNIDRINYAAGVSERKKALFNEIFDEFKKLEEYENLIRIPHLHFYRYAIQTKVYTSSIYFEAVQEEMFDYYINEAINSAERMREIFESSRMKGVRDKVEMHHILDEVYMMKASFTISRTKKLEYLKKCEVLLLEDEKVSAAWSPQIYITWRDLSSIYLELSKVERNQTYFEKGVFYAKKTYNSAVETEKFKDALFEAYKIAIMSEDYQDYTLSKEYYKAAHYLTDKILQAGKEYSYYYDLKTYLQARLQGVKAKEAHLKGNYTEAMRLYHKASSLLQLNTLYSYEALLYNVYSLFEEAALCFIKEEYRDTLKTLSKIGNLFDETVTQHAEEYEPQFHYFIDRRAFDLQQLFFESSKIFSKSQSHILQSLIYRNSGESEKAVELLREANTLLSQFKDRDIHIAGYYSFANGLYGLEQSELSIRDSDYKSAASYLASASVQFENASTLLASDEGLRTLCEGLKSFCQGWMYALEIMRRGKDLNSDELNKNYTLAHQSLKMATTDLKMFRKTYNSVHGFEKLLGYIYYSLLFQKTDNPADKSEIKEKMPLMLIDALKYFQNAEDMERYNFTRDVLINLPQLEDVRENVFKPIDLPFTPYTPVFDLTRKLEPSGIFFVVELDKTQIEVNDTIQYSIEITSDTLIHLKRIDGIFPKKGIKVISGVRLAKNGMVQIDRSLPPGTPMRIEFAIRALTPFYSRKHPQLIYFSTKNEKHRIAAKPISLQIYPKNVLKEGIADKINKKLVIVNDILKELEIMVGEFPIVYHNLTSYRETLSEFFVYMENNDDTKKRRFKKFNASKVPIQQMAFVDPLGDVNILYDMERYLYPRSITSLLNIIVHEKFGHGIFYQNTALGKTLLELEYHRKGIALLTKELEKVSNKYAIGVQWLCLSTLIVNEGFAIWLTLKVLSKLREKTSKIDPKLAEKIHHEIENIKTLTFADNNLNIKHEYFALKYKTPIINPYAKGYNLFLQIEEKYGDKCVLKALEISSDISLTRRQISIMPNIVKNDKNCADKRLEKIARSDLKIERNNVNMFEKVIQELF